MNNEQTKTPGQIAYEADGYFNWEVQNEYLHKRWERIASAVISHVLQGAKWVLVEDGIWRHGDEVFDAEPDSGWTPIDQQSIGSKIYTVTRRPISLPSSVRPEGKPLGGLAEFFGGEFPRPSTAPPVSSGAAGADVPEAEPLMVLKHEPDVPANLFSGQQGPAIPSVEPVVEEKPERNVHLVELLRGKTWGDMIPILMLVDLEWENAASERDQLRKELESTKVTFKVAEQEVIRLSTENAALTKTYKDCETLWQKTLQDMRDGTTIRELEASFIQAEQDNAELEQELTRLRSQFRWTPISERLPTEKDADEKGCVWIWDQDFRDAPARPVREIHWKNLHAKNPWVWMTPVPLSEPSPETEEQKKAAWLASLPEQHRSTLGWYKLIDAAWEDVKSAGGQA